MGVNNHILLCQLEAQPRVDYACNDCDSSYPAVHVSEYALATGSLEMPMLQDAQDWLKEYECADDDEAYDAMRMHRIMEVSHVFGDSDAESHAANHHEECYNLDGCVYGHDFVSEIGISKIRDLLDGEVD